MKTKSLFAALLAILIGTSYALAAKKAPTPAPTLTPEGKKLEAKYAAEMKSLKADIKKAVSKIGAPEKAAYQKALKELQEAQSKLDTAKKGAKGDVKKAEALVNHAKNKWIRGANNNIAKAKKKLKAAKNDGQRKKAEKELAAAEKNLAAGEKALKQRMKALEIAKNAKTEGPKMIKDAEAEVEKAKTNMQKVLKQTGLGDLLAGGSLDAKLVKFVVLHDGTPAGLAEFAEKGAENKALIDKLLADTDLMKQMLVADGAARPRVGRGLGPAQFGPTMKIYTEIEKKSPKAKSGVLQRLALAIALEHAVPISQRNPKAETDAPSHVDPVKRYLHFEKAYENGELDPAFKYLKTWDLRMVVDGNEPDKTLAWGREMLRNFHPDHIYNPNYGWRYVNIVGTDVRYGSGDVKYDRPELQFFQNVLMNGGVCGRRAFIGRFILRAFGMPTTARPQRGHAALVHWTPKGWVANLGGGWGAGWTKGYYHSDLDFLASTQARALPEDYMQVKRAQWIGDAMGEDRVYGEHQKGAKPEFWNKLSLSLQRSIINDSKAETLAALGSDIGESNKFIEAQKAIDVSLNPEDKKVVYGSDGTITIPAAGYSKKYDKNLYAMKSFDEGAQVFMRRFAPEGVTILRGGAWRGGVCKAGDRLPSSGYGKYNNWGFRAAMSATGDNNPKEITLDLGNGVKMEMVYIKPGKFIMGGDNTKDGKWNGVAVPKHEVTISKGFYMGKYEVTQQQFQEIMKYNPSKGGKDPKCPADNVSEADAVKFCQLVAGKTDKPVRLPTEAEWEYACRAGTQTDWFFGSDPSKYGEYAWYKGNDGGKSHPVGQKKPNPWGLYDIFGNVCERVADRYHKDYYKQGPKIDPTGPSLKKKSYAEYKINAPKAGKYALSAKVVTVNYAQQLIVSVNGAKTDIMLPFTCGSWGESKPVTVNLKQGENTISVYRLNPPQQGVSVKSYTLKPL